MKEIGRLKPAIDVPRREGHNLPRMVDIRQVAMGAGGAGFRDFLGVVDRVYEGDPHYIRPLDLDIEGAPRPEEEPVLRSRRGHDLHRVPGRRRVGRITAQIDHEHLERHKDDAGLLRLPRHRSTTPRSPARCSREAEAWLRARGMKTVRGPLSLSINEELGCLVEGFDTRRCS